MNTKEDNIPDPKDLEKEIGDFLAKKFGGNVKIISPMALSKEFSLEKTEKTPGRKKIQFDLKPEDLVAYLDQFIVKQDDAKAILATKICTHFNRIKNEEQYPDSAEEMVGRIKNNVLMIGPTGVGKTYMVKLIAKKIGVPFVKGDATKFSETGYVGGDVEDLVRDLVRETDGDVDLAQYGIIYIDEIDKIASSHNFIGADVSRTGVQRALLKPMEETEVELKVPHDPISMIQEIERFRKTGKREKRTINTKDILFIMSGAFADLSEIIRKRVQAKGIGFGAQLPTHQFNSDLLKHVKAEDLIAFGFESEFVGRLPVRAIFENLAEADLYEILKSPNNPIILGKKLDFAAYDILVKFEDAALKIIARDAFLENTGARGIVSSIERKLLPFEKVLPSTGIKKFPVTEDVVRDPQQALAEIKRLPTEVLDDRFNRLVEAEYRLIKDYTMTNRERLTERYTLTLSPSRIELIAKYYIHHIMDVGNVVRRIKNLYDEVKKTELLFYKNHDINIVLEEDAIDFIIEQFITSSVSVENFFRQFSSDFELGLKLVRDKTGRNRFFITKQALLNPEEFLSNLIRTELKPA